MNEALKALERIKEFYLQWHLYNRKDFNVIETALKRLNYIDENRLSDEDIHIVQGMTFEDKVECIKKLKALEIIKEKDIDFKTLKKAFVFNGSNKEQCEMYNANQWQWVFDLAHPGCVDTNRDKLPQLVQEEYDILREVLL